MNTITGTQPIAAATLRGVPFEAYKGDGYPLSLERKGISAYARWAFNGNAPSRLKVYATPSRGRFPVTIFRRVLE